MANDEGELIQASQVRARYGGVSDMWLHRRLHDNSNFPKPIYITKRRYWRLADLVAWERACAALSVAVAA